MDVEIPLLYAVKQGKYCGESFVYLSHNQHLVIQNVIFCQMTKQNLAMTEEKMHFHTVNE